ncbi:MAG TPA: hydantoinase/oxoprolinase family protein [Egibacteraceae bacterium]|nr:hydantoinase/oxoprolinase family protein [Egibacteraceae bacterium]
MASGPGAGWLIAIDTGGTFTDAVAISPRGDLRVTKVPSTPDDPARALAHAVEELAEQGVALGDVQLLFHGTTVATNAAITGQLAEVVLVATAGYRDVLAYRTGGRPELYDLQQPRPRELVRRHRRLEVHERLAWNGDVVTALTDEEIERVVDEVASHQPEAIAVCLLFSYMNDVHEQRLAQALRDRIPDVPVTVSSEIAREFREYPRTATTVLNAGLRPLVGSYLIRAKQLLADRGMTRPFMVMQSNGGSVPAERADAEAHRLLLSGPTAGVAGTVALGARYGLNQLISLDMGGTSLDVCLIRDGQPPVTTLEEVDCHPILAPSVDVVTVGAGGGSIASVDVTGRLRVGPHSAGAVPGPAAYGRGGKDATLTDAHVVTGVLGGGLPLAGRLELDADASREAVGRIADRLQLDVEAAGEGIIAVAMAHVVRALRGVSVQRGIDPRECTVVAFGGAGPLHAGRLLDELEVDAVIVPRHPGLFSAAGLVAADLRVDDSQTVLRVLDPAHTDDLAEWYRAAAQRLHDQLRADGVPEDRIRVVGSADCRYLGQGYELNVPVRGFEPDALAGLHQDFGHAHHRTYGHVADEPLELVTLRVSAFGALPRADAPPSPVTAATHTPRALRHRRRATLPGGGTGEIPVYDRDLLAAGNVLAGPAIIEEMDSTTVLLAGQSARVDEHEAIWITRQEAPTR